MKMFIPTLKTKLKLTKKWSFSLFKECRNVQLFAAMKLVPPEELKKIENAYTRPWLNQGSPLSMQVGLPVGTILEVDRIYIRKGNEEFDSMTFRVDSCPDRELLTGTLPAIVNRWRAEPLRVEDSATGRLSYVDLCEPREVQKRFKKPRFWAKMEDVNKINFVEVKNA